MTAPTPVGFLDFFILEASDYIDQLDAQLLAGHAAGPDADALQRVARALRGSATMAKVSSFSELAAGIERVGRSLREGMLHWNPALSGVLVAAVDDCKVLLRNVRAWSDADETRARARIGELTSLAPLRSLTPRASPTLLGHENYLATESSNIGAGLELLATRPTDRDAATHVLRRVRALRGIASVKDHASLADVLEAAEQAARPLDLGEAALSPERIAVLSAAATVLRGVATAIRAGDSSDAPEADVAVFTAALEAWQERETGAERVLPVSELFYDDDGPTVVDASVHPPTTPPQRFRLEAMSQGEHLRRLVADARGARGDVARERVHRALRQALRALHQAAESFGERDVATFVASHNDAALRLDAQALDGLDEVATLLAQPGTEPAPIAERLAALKLRRTSMTSGSMTPIMSSAAVPAPTSIPEDRLPPAAAALAAAATRAAGGAPRLGNLLDAGITGLGALERAPLLAPSAVAEQPPVSIDVLLYRGRSAIERAREIRDQVRLRSGPVDADALGELFDLLDLALVD